MLPPRRSHHPDPGRQATFDVARRGMVESQLRRRGLRDERVLAAMGTVPREEFVPPELWDSAYDDRPLAIGQGQTISQPYTVANMIEALQLAGGDRVLEIGTGSGYAASVLSCIAREVYTIERLPKLAQTAAARLQRLGYDNVQVICGDGTLGLPEYAPYDAIVVTAGAPYLPQPYRDQLAPGGRVVIPIGSTPRCQTMCRFTRHADHFQEENLGQYAFVPLIGEQGWNADLPD